jgi:hypothetical protein
MFGNKAPKKIFVSKKEVKNSGYYIVRIVKYRKIRWAGNVARMRKTRNSYRILVGKPTGRRPLGRSRRRWEDKITIDFRKSGCEGRRCMVLVQGGH